MGKVYLKTKYDNEMKMEIPHNHNFASAMFGFREMAAEIVPYHLIDDIYDDFKREDIALDYIDQCNVLFNKFGVTRSVPSGKAYNRKKEKQRIGVEFRNGFDADFLRSLVLLIHFRTSERSE